MFNIDKPMHVHWPIKIALLDSDLKHAATVRKVLSSGGFDCQIFSDGRAVLRQMERDEFRVLILDWDGGQLGGEKVLGWARRALGACFPVMFLTAHQSEDDMVKALVAGADDYLIRPVDAPLLLASVRKLLRQPHRAGHSRPANVFGNLEFLGGGVVRVNGKPVRLSPKEYSLARILFRNLNRKVSREIMIREIWPHAQLETDRTIDVHIHSLRNKLGLRLERGYCLRAIYGFGYALQEIPQPSPPVADQDKSPAC